MDSKDRFSGLGEDYDRFRPGYSGLFLDFLRARYSLGRGMCVADVGAGTGILTGQLLESGCEVFAVEPSRDMREVARRKLADGEACHVVEGSAERTTLGDGSVDLVLVAQAFHWFDGEAFKGEFRRISRTGKAVLLWNVKKSSQPYLADLERVNRAFCKDFKGFNGGFSLDSIEAFFDGEFGRQDFAHDLSLDREAFVKGILTASYTPREVDEGYEAYVGEVEAVFDRFSRGGRLLIENDTEAFFN
ncbi:MAG: class I SAM-dependent methyltransferase [Spirochaetales bacterium]|nr:class I SAM-dependent methyltransferase [Spirochaetales bacterium]